MKPVAIKVCTDFTADVRTITEVGGQMGTQTGRLGKERWVLCRSWIALNLLNFPISIYSPFFWEITGNYKKIRYYVCWNMSGKPPTIFAQFYGCLEVQTYRFVWKWASPHSNNSNFNYHHFPYWNVLKWLLMGIPISMISPYFQTTLQAVPSQPGNWDEKWSRRRKSCYSPTGSDIVYNGTYIYICIYIYIILNKLHLNIIRLIKYNIIRHDSHDHL